MTTQQLSGVVPDWTLGDRLRKARSVSGLTVSELAERTGISAKTINNYEGDKVKTRRPALMAWALVTGVSLEWLEHGTGSARPTPPDGGRVAPVDELTALTEAKRARSGRSRGVADTCEYVAAA